MIKLGVKSTDVSYMEPMVKAVVNRLLLSRPYFHLYIDRDDLYQIGWLAVLNCADKFDESRGVQFSTYATRSIINAVNNELKRLSTKKLYSITTDSFELAPPEISDKIMRAVIEVVESNKFARQERNIFWKRFLDDLSYKEIGKQTNLCRETVRQIYIKTLNKVKELMVNEYED